MAYSPALDWFFPFAYVANAVQSAFLEDSHVDCLSYTETCSYPRHAAQIQLIVLLLSTEVRLRQANRLCWTSRIQLKVGKLLQMG